MSYQRWLALSAVILIVAISGAFLSLEKKEEKELTKKEDVIETEPKSVNKISVAFEPGMKYPPTLRLTGPEDFLERVAQCKYVNGFLGPGGIGVTVEWGDGTTSPDWQKVDSMRGQSCTDEMTQHSYAASGTYTITVHLWHPGSTDAPVTEWKDIIEVSVP